eukprot:TRINITY_DN21533_c0_g1_i13.p1 TRINITY_DN21533_c0_g1~~TRINITY_DN21533_c0_g1_i13.p1  ORF type:complete len:138 (-),score=19.97 TRINITY_DN21533_c0_g1_i13:417-782(-)
MALQPRYAYIRKRQFESSLSGALKSMGIKDAFNQASADFSQMVDLSTTPNNVFISEGFHKAKIVVDEKGTVASAATGLSITALAMILPSDFYVDEPFVFMIVHKPSQQVLFMGKVVDPSES